MSLAAQLLVVDVGAPRGAVVVFRVTAVPYPRNGTGASLTFSRAPDGRFPRDVGTLTTDDRGRASVRAPSPTDDTWQLQGAARRT